MAIMLAKISLPVQGWDPAENLFLNITKESHYLKLYPHETLEESVEVECWNK